MDTFSGVTPIRTDTRCDHSQKAKKGALLNLRPNRAAPVRMSGGASCGFCATLLRLCQITPSDIAIAKMLREGAGNALSSDREVFSADGHQSKLTAHYMRPAPISADFCKSVSNRKSVSLLEG